MYVISYLNLFFERISLACLVASGLSCIFHLQNILHNGFIPGRSFIYIKSKSGLSTDLCRTLYIIFFHSYVWPFKTTVVKVVHLQHHKRLKWLHHAKHYQRLLTPLASTVGFFIKISWILWIVNWAIHESPARNPD